MKNGFSRCRWEKGAAFMKKAVKQNGTGKAALFPSPKQLCLCRSAASLRLLLGETASIGV